MLTNTLLPCRGVTASFLYQVQRVTPAQLVAWQRQNPQQPLMQILHYCGAQFTFIRACNRNFRTTLRYVDSSMEQLTAELLKLHYTTGQRSLQDLTEALIERNPLNMPTDGPYRTYIRRLLLAIALWMQPNLSWDGRQNPHSSHHIITPRGNIITHDAYDPYSMGDYLIRHCQMTHSRHQPSPEHLRIENGSIYLKLPLQIRYITTSA